MPQLQRDVRADHFEQWRSCVHAVVQRASVRDLQRDDKHAQKRVRNAVRVWVLRGLRNKGAAEELHI